MELNIKTAGAMDVVRSGATVTLQYGKLDGEIIRALLEHGIAAKVGDAAASATAVAGESHFGKPKKDVAKGDWDAWKETKGAQESIAAIAQSAMESVLDTLYANKWTQGRSGIRTARLDDVSTIAVKSAKADLLIMFKRVTQRAKLVDMAAHEKVAPFFQAAGDGVAWDDTIVLAWIGKQADAGKRDYMAEAKASMDVDLTDLEL